MEILKKIFYCSFLLITSLFATAQDTSQANKTLPAITNEPGKKIFVKDITITGNKRTKTFIILREMQFKKGDSLRAEDFYKELEQARKQVYNTTLFNEVLITSIASTPTEAHIIVTVKERWYVYPIPQFQLVDRNFNVWWKTFHHSFNRVNYGLKFTHYNLTGRRDALKIYLISGYSRNISFTYANPYINKALTRGFSVGAGYTQNREVSYRTTFTDSALFYSAGPLKLTTADFVRQSWYASASYSIRNGFFTRQVFSGGYTYLKVDDSVTIKNPNYFGDSTRSKGFPELAYIYQYTNVDNNAYSLKGTSYYVALVKRGWGLTGGINMFSIEGGINKYYSLGKKWYSNFQLSAKIKLPFEQAYFNQRALGYGETYLRGLEYNVIDGVAYGLLRSTLKRKIVSFNIPFPFFPKIITKIPFTLFAKAYTDFGYVYNKPKYDTRLTNCFLYTGGLGIDVLTLYDINLRFEYSINQLGSRGLFFHTQNGF